MISKSSNNMQSLGKIDQRVPAVCAKMWCLCVERTFQKTLEREAAERRAGVTKIVLSAERRKSAAHMLRT